MSTPIILSAPRVLPPVPMNQWQGLVQEWVGPDGSVWDLNAWESGIILDSRGVEGLHNPVLTRQTSKSRRVPGHRLRGWRAEAREVFWPVFVYADDSADWLARHRDFFDTIRPDQPGTWRVTALGETRELLLTGVFGDGHAYETDPLLDGWGQYGVTMEAQQPYWRGKKVRRGPWKTPDPAPFFSGPPFTISSSTTFGSAFIPNEGDVDVWGVWWATGPLSSIELGVGETLIRPPFDLEVGEMLRIDTDPRNPTAQKGAVPLDGEGNVDTDLFEGDDVTTELGLQDYASVPPGASVELHVDAVGSGSVMFDLEPLFFRAF